MKRSGPEKSIVKDPELGNYRISPQTVTLLTKMGVSKLFPVQQATFDLIFEGRDLMGRDLTGSGKTLAYVLPLVERFRQAKTFENGHRPIVMVMVPTRELAIQTANVFNQLKYSDEYRVVAVYGGAHIEPQIEAFRRGADIIVGTTGRLLDHLGRGTLPTSDLKCLIMDEADRMLDMGFQEDVEKIYGIVKKNTSTLQCLLFSATFPGWVQNVARKFLSTEFELVDLVKNLANKTVSSVKHLAMYCPHFDRSVLADVILCYAGTTGKSIVFTQTKADANDLYLSDKLKGVEVLHGDIPQQQREVTYKGFKEGRFNILVATDVASRGLDIPDVDLIVQCEPPKDVESYIHRAGRTARAGKSGTVVTFYNKKQVYLMQKIEEAAGITFSKINAPQKEDLVKASSKFILEALRKVDENSLDKYQDAVDAVINEFGEKKALLLAVGYITAGGTNKLREKSLLNGNEGAATFMLEADSELRSNNFVWGVLRRFLPVVDISQIKQLIPCRDARAMIFDVPESASSRLEAAFKHEQNKGRHLGYVIKKLKELPELAENNNNPSHENHDSLYGWGAIADPRLKSDDEPKEHHSHHHNHNYEESRAKSTSKSHDALTNGNDIFMWGLKTEDDIKDFLTEHKLAWQRIKVLKDEKGESKMAAFVTLDKYDVEAALKLNGVKIRGRQLKINPANQRPAK